MKAILSIYFPTLFIDVLLRAKTKKHNRSANTGDVVVCNDSVLGDDPEKQSELVVAAVLLGNEKYVARCSRNALHQGLASGIKLPQACARFPNLEIYDFSFRKERAYLRSLARYCLRYSPISAVDEPVDLNHPLSKKNVDNAKDLNQQLSANVLFNHRHVGINLDLTGSERVLGGYAKFIEGIAAEFASWGLFARLSLSPSLAASWALSRFLPKRISIVSPEQLKTFILPLPIAALHLSQATETRLHQVNVKTIGELNQIPRRALVARFGSEVVMRLDQTWSLCEEVLTPVPDKQTLECFHHFPEPVANLLVVKNCCDELLTQVLALVKERCRLLSQFRLEIFTDGTQMNSKVFSINSPTILQKEISKRIQLFLDTANLGRGVLSVKLIVLRTAAEPTSLAYDLDLDRNLSLEANSAATENPSLASCHVGNSKAKSARKRLLPKTLKVAEEQGRLLDTLQDRLGEKQVLELHYRQSYFPERTFSYTMKTIDPKEHSSSMVCAALANQALLYERPSLLFSQPEEITVLAVIPNGVPFQITWRRRTFKVLKGFGPERICSEWWSGEKNSNRDYFKIQINSGAWIWVFKETLLDKWFIHGTWV